MVGSVQLVGGKRPRLLPETFVGGRCPHLPHKTLGCPTIYGGRVAPSNSFGGGLAVASSFPNSPQAGQGHSVPLNCNNSLLRGVPEGRGVCLRPSEHTPESPLKRGQGYHLRVVFCSLSRFAGPRSEACPRPRSGIATTPGDLVIGQLAPLNIFRVYLWIVFNTCLPTYLVSPDPDHRPLHR